MYVVYTNSKNQKANKGICNIWHYPHALKTGKSYGFFKSSNINNKVEHSLVDKKWEKSY